MPGRGQARSRYNRGGRGRGNKPRFHNNRKKPKDETKKGLKDYTYYVGNNRQATDFETTTEFIINHIKKTYSHGIDIAAALSSIYHIKPIIPHLQLRNQALRLRRIVLQLLP